jgi:hypothetical protein
MKSEVNKPVTNKYPALYEHEDGDVIIVIEDGATTLVGTIVKSASFPIGEYRNHWLKGSFKRMESGTTVTLTQPNKLRVY